MLKLIRWSREDNGVQAVSAKWWHQHWDTSYFFFNELSWAPTRVSSSLVFCSISWNLEVMKGGRLSHYVKSVRSLLLPLPSGIFNWYGLFILVALIWTLRQQCIYFAGSISDECVLIPTPPHNNHNNSVRTIATFTRLGISCFFI